MEWITSTEGKPWVSCTELAAEAGDTLSLGEARQTVRGFGGCFNELGMIALRDLPEADRAAVFDELFCPDKCNFTFNRMSVGANDFAESWYSYDEVDGDFEMEHFSIDRDRLHVIPYIREAQKRQPAFSLFASPWSPPTWLKYPKAYNYGTMIRDEKHLRAYAKYVRLFLQAYEGEGIHVDQYHIQNEPCSTQKFPSCIWTGEEFRDFIRDYLLPELEANGVNTDIWLGTLNGPEGDHRWTTTRYHQYAGIVMEDPVCRRAVKGIAYQWAGKSAVQATHDAYPDLELIQSESECGDSQNTWTAAMYIFEMIRHYFRNGVTAYVYWNMALREGGESTWGWHQNSLVTVKDGKATYTPEFYLMKHFSHFVKPGAKVLTTLGTMSPNCLAFENPDGGRVVVMMNPYDFVKTVTVEGKSYPLPPRSFNSICF